MNGERMLNVDYTYLLAWVSLVFDYHSICAAWAVSSINKDLVPKPQVLGIWLPAGHFHLAALQAIKMQHVI